MAVQHQQQKQSSPAQVAGVVSFYMTAALVMVFVNKAVLNSSPELPLLFLLIQLLIAVALLHLSSALFSHKIDLPRLELETAKKLAPVVLVNIIGLVFNTLCLRDVEASFFQIARGMQLPLTILVSSISTRQQPTGRVLIAAGTVTIGFLLGVSPSSFSSLSFSLTPAAPSVAQPSDHKAPGLVSLIYGVLSALFIAFHSVLIKSSLPHCNGSTIHLAYWTNLGSALFLFPFVLLTGEFFKVLSLALNKVDASVGGEWNASVFVWGSLVTGVFGFLLCVAGLLSIKVTSPVTHMFSSAARSVLQTLLGVWLFGDLLNVNRATSIIVILLGTMYYTWAKHVEGLQRSPSSSSSSSAPGGSSSSSLSESIGMKDRERDLEGQTKWGKKHGRRTLETVTEDESESDEDVVFDAEKGTTTTTTQRRD
ncbi:hypothetical protein ACEPAF_4097 [Sanghuangporus sanghuang]